MIMLQPNGLYACWSNIIDNFTAINMTRDECKLWLMTGKRMRSFEADNAIGAGAYDIPLFTYWDGEEVMQGSGLDRWNEKLLS